VLLRGPPHRLGSLMDDFLAFVVERHRIWEQRQAGAPQPWTADPVLASRKFTNVFRVLDPGTQFVLNELLDPTISDRDQLMRLFLYRHTGRIDSWEWVRLSTGQYPTVATLEDTRAAFKEWQATGRPVFTNAYLVYPQSSKPGTDKLDSIIDLTARLFDRDSPDDVMRGWRKLPLHGHQAERFRLLRRNKGVGDFMSMQVLTDWSYSLSRDMEDEFLVPGPGSIKGAKALRPNSSVGDTVKEVFYQVRELPQCPRLGYRVPSLMDIGSNLLCEWSKYVRFRAQPSQPKPYVPAHPGPQPTPVLPAYYTEGDDLL
jgi:hypothetical protein